MVKARESVLLASIVLLGPARADDATVRQPDATDTTGSRRDLLPPDGIDWATFQALQTAAAEATRKGPTPEACRIQVTEWGNRLLVTFDNAAASTGWKGCAPGPCKCFEVEVARDGRQVLRAAFTR